MVVYLKEKVLVSACLLGVNCKYNGNNNYRAELKAKLQDKEIILACPEVMGGLSIPRKPAEIVHDKVVTIEGDDVTTKFCQGAKETLDLCQKLGIKKAILKANSPSCGVGQVYDGSFTGKLVDKDGITAKLLIENGIEVMSDIDFLKKQEKQRGDRNL